MHPWVKEANGRTVVLLGAGASQPSVPTSRDLTRRVVDELTMTYVGDLQVHELWRALLPTIKRLTRDGCDIEYLFQAVETLGYREIDPTRHWIHGFRRYGQYSRSKQGRSDFARDARSLAQTIVNYAYSIVEQSSTDASTAHFEPLLRAPLAGIATLNYDTLVEEAAQRCEVAVSTGAENWDAGPKWRFPNNRLPLLKLHGSVNWRHSAPLSPSWGIPRIGIYELPRGEKVAPNGRVDSTLIFGGGNKLRPEGPWPALYSAFEELLSGADVLVIVGYSFRDAHVDAAVRRWAAGAPDRRVVVIEPSPSEHPSISSSIGDLRHALDPDFVSAEGVPSRCHSANDRRFELVKKKTLDSLPDIFGR